MSSCARIYYMGPLHLDHTHLASERESPASSVQPSTSPAVWAKLAGVASFQLCTSLKKSAKVENSMTYVAVLVKQFSTIKNTGSRISFGIFERALSSSGLGDCRCFLLATCHPHQNIHLHLAAHVLHQCGPQCEASSPSLFQSGGENLGQLLTRLSYETWQ